jgi:hypothetical protein
MPAEWASYARASNARSGTTFFAFPFSFFFENHGNQSKGSAACEGYNSRLDSIMPHKPFALDKMVDFLAGEDEYWCRVVNDP